MGRGGTKFEGEAIGVRSGRIKKGLSAKDIKKEMEVSAVQHSHAMPMTVQRYCRKGNAMSANCVVHEFQRPHVSSYLDGTAICTAYLAMHAPIAHEDAA